jgi:alcohol dehydrogenase YqhD (iron-dependent ADH family)
MPFFFFLSVGGADALSRLTYVARVVNYSSELWRRVITTSSILSSTELPIGELKCKSSLNFTSTTKLAGKVFRLPLG